MRKFIFLLLLAASVTVWGQDKSLYRVNVIKPKPGMLESFEASWKQHIDKYHQTTSKLQVYEVTSGSDIGSLVVVEGPLSYTDMDTDRPDRKEHTLDLDKNIQPKTEPQSNNALQRLNDTLSYNPGGNGDKVLITVTVVKDGKLQEYMSEVRRTVLTLTKLNTKASYATLVQQQAGSSPTLITVRNLQQGYKELEPNFLMGPNDFKNAYVKEYGQYAWDARVKLLVDDVVSRGQHFERFRADLSSK